MNGSANSASIARRRVQRAGAPAGGARAAPSAASSSGRSCVRRMASRRPRLSDVQRASRDAATSPATIAAECRGRSRPCQMPRQRSFDMRRLARAARRAAVAALRARAGARCAHALPQAARCARRAPAARCCAPRARARCRGSPPACPVCALPSPGAARLRRVPRASAAVRRDASPRSSTRFRSTACCSDSSTAARLALADWAGASSPRAAAALARAARSAPARPRRRRCRSRRRASASAASTRRARSRARVARRARRCRSRRRSSASRARPPQAALPWAERARNVRGAFAVRADVARRAHRARRRRDDDRRHARRGRARRCARAGAARVECLGRRAYAAARHVMARRHGVDAVRTFAVVLVASGDPAQHRQRDPPHRQHGDRAAPGRAARLPDGRPRPEARRARLSRVRARRACTATSPPAAPRSTRARRGAGSRSRRAARARSTTRASRRATCSCSAARPRGCPTRSLARVRAPTRGCAIPMRAGRAQPQPVERRRGRRLRGLAAARGLRGRRT